MGFTRALALIAGLQLTLASCAGSAAHPRAELSLAEVSGQAGGRVALGPDSAMCASGDAVADVAAPHRATAPASSHIAPRWPEGPGQAVTVHIDDASRIDGWKPAFRAEVGKAFRAWEDAGAPVKFAVVDDAAGASVRVHWIDRFDAHYEGWTTVSWDHAGSLINGDVTLALHSPKGQLLTASERTQVAMHEVGHVLGLSHSTIPTSIMSPTIHVTAIAPADIESLRALYGSSGTATFSVSAAQGGSAADRCSARKL